ncbi:MAG: AarF/UbiB family protein [Polyangiales bacterium]
MPSVMTAFRDLERLRAIAVVLARHGFGEVLQRLGLDTLVPTAVDEATRTRSFGQRLRFVLQDLGPSFVKLGQIASTRADLLPPDVIAELKVLQDDVKTVPWEAIRKEIEDDLGAPLADLFEHVDPEPLASASIAQVHRGKLRDGEAVHDVAVKVQRPGIRDTVERDVDLLYWFARALERTIPESRRYSPVDLVSEFDRSIQAELDFKQEAEHAERFARNFEGDARVRFPKVYARASGKRVLTLEFFDGRHLDDALAEGWDGKRIASMSIGVVIKMVFEDGFFHADPHPGNVMVMGTPEAPVLGLLDLGLVGHLSGPLRDKALELMVAAVREDFDAVADALYALGRPTRKVDMQVFRNDVATLGRKYVGRKLGDIQASAIVRDLIWGAVKHGIDMPADFVMMGRALMTLEGTGRQIHPELDLLQEARPHFLRLIAQRYSPDRVSGDLLRMAFKLSTRAGQMPDQVSEILDDLRKGHLTLKASDPQLNDVYDRLGRRVHSALTVSAMVLGGSVILALGRGYVMWLGAVMLVGAALLATGHMIRDWWRSLALRR